MKIDVHMTDTETQKRMVYRPDYDEDEFSDFIWCEGNYACDCNRGKFFYGGNFNCGSSRFLVDKIVDRETKELLYSETGEDR